MMSSTFSIPTEMRTMPSVIPICSSALLAKSGVGHGSGMGDESLHSAQRFSQGTYSHFFQQLLGIRKRSGFEGDHGAEAAHLLLRQFVLGMLWQSGIKNFLHFLVARQEFRYKSSVAIVLLHAHGKSLDAAQDQPAFERRKNRPGSFLHKGQLLGLLRNGAYNDSAQAVAVAVEEFCGGVHNHVGAQRDRLLKIWRHESVVDYQFYFLAAANLADGLQGH